MVRSDAPSRNALHELGYKIFLDRYAQKDMTRATLAVGDTVIVVVDPKTGQREIGTVKALRLPRVQVELLDGEVVERDVEHVDKPLETDPSQMMDRVAAGIAAVEATPELRALWTERFRWLLDDWKFVPGGRILAAAGTDQELTFYNCYVIPSPRDSRSGIIETLRQMTEIMSRGGGVGINISSLRPRHAYVKGVNGRSSGAVSWGALYSFVTGLIEQGGCFSPTTRILTEKGLIPAQELAERLEQGETFYAQTHKGLRRITARFRNGVKPLFEVRTKRGYRVQVTEDHKIAVLMDGQVTTMALRYLRPGDEILLMLGEGVQGEYQRLRPVRYHRSVMSAALNTAVRLPEVLDEKLAYLIGYLYGDGYIHTGKKVNWRAPKAFKLATADDYPEIRERLMTTIEQVFGVRPTLVEGDGACKTIAVHSRLIIEWLNENGLLKPKAGSVRVPEVIFRSPSTVVGAFIAGYFDADGIDRGEKGGYGIDSVSYAMLQDVQTLLSANGIVTHIHSQDRSGSGWRTLHRLVVTGAQFRQRFAAFAPAEKLKSGGQKRDMLNTYPASVWSALGARTKYRQRIDDGVSQRVSYNQLTAIRERLLEDDQVETAAQMDDLMRVMPDTIASIAPLDAAETFDFEVEDVHLLSGDGIYTSNSRRGALMLILNDWHPDVFDFINSKRRMGQITNANISVGVSDRFMEAVKADGDWELMFPDTSYPDYDDVWDGDLDKWMADGRRVIHYRTVKARQVWDAIIESAWASAEPGVFFRERYNKMSNSWYYAPIICTNPCVTGDTRIYTDKGLVTARELFEDETAFEVTVDRRFGLPAATAPSSRVFMTGRKPVYRLQTQEGYYVRATADHRFMTPNGWAALSDLRPGDKVHVLNRKGGFGVEGSLELGRALGWLASGRAVERDAVALPSSGEANQALASAFAEHVNARVAPLTATQRAYAAGVGRVATLDEARVNSAQSFQIAADYGLADSRRRVPEAVFRGSEAMQRGFLQALFTADGSFQEGGSIRLTADVVELLEGVQQLLANFGIASRICRSQADCRQLPDAERSPQEDWRQAQHELVIGQANLAAFADEIGFLADYKQAALADYVARGEGGSHGEDFLATVEAVTEDGFEDVFDLTEPLTHSFVANSLVVHNCGEQGLPAFGVCNLGAINLARFYDAEKHDVDWETLDRTARYATRFLDNVIDSTLYFFEENRKQQLSERRVGLNNMGLAELMIRLGIRYGSEESVQFIDKLYGFLARAIYETSIELAREKGPFPKFDAEKFLNSGFMRTMPEDIREKVRQYGIRNVTLTTQAPTGTTGTMVNTSTGIEPFFSWVYYRKSRLGLHEEQVPLVKEWFEAHPGATQLPDYFVTAMDLSPEEHVRVQAAIQRWVDSSISKTCNVPRHYTVEQVRALYEYMYELGCKGGTIYRDGSRDEQVLMLKTDAPAESKDAGAKTSANGDLTASQSVEQVATPHRVYPRPKRLAGVTVSRKTPFGTAYITMNSDEHGNPFEVFITVGKAGSDLQADAEGLGRMLSLQLRTTAPQNRMEMLKLIIDQLQGIGGTRSVGMGASRVTSLPDAVAGALLEQYFPQNQAQQLGLPLGNGQTHASPSPALDAGPISGADMCPACGTVSLVRVEGCRKCLTCGYSEC